MENIRDVLRTKINAKHQMKIEDDLEYSFAVGQAIAYLQSKSKAKNNIPSILCPFFILLSFLL